MACPYAEIPQEVTSRNRRIGQGTSDTQQGFHSAASKSVSDSWKAASGTRTLEPFGCGVTTPHAQNTCNSLMFFLSQEKEFPVSASKTPSVSIFLVPSPLHSCLSVAFIRTDKDRRYYANTQTLFCSVTVGTDGSVWIPCDAHMKPRSRPPFPECSSPPYLLSAALSQSVSSREQWTVEEGREDGEGKKKRREGGSGGFFDCPHTNGPPFLV